MMEEGLLGSWETACANKQRYMGSGHLDDRGEIDSWSGTIKKKNAFLLVPYLWEGEIGTKGLCFLL